jgi:hypothetical protein
MKEHAVIVTGGTTGGDWTALSTAFADNEWMVKVVIGAIVGTVISILLNELYKWFKSKIKGKK